MPSILTRPSGGGGGGGGSIAISYSNNTPTYGDTITIAATPTGITPTSYTFIIAGNIDETITVQAGNTLSWVVNTLNPTIYVQATDAISFAASVDSSLTVSSITEAGTFITALETLTSDTMGGRQKDAVNRLVWMLNGNDTTNSTDLWTMLTATNAAWYIYCPNDDSTAYFDGYKIDLLDPTHTGTFINMVAGDISVEGVKGGAGKALNMDVQPADFDLNNIMCHFYQSKYGFELLTVPMGAHITDQNSDGVSAFWQFNQTAAVIRVNNAGGGSSASKKSITGVMSFGRDNATQVKIATNGNYDGTAGAASSSAITEDFYAHGYHNASTGVSTNPSANTYAGFAVTPWLSANEYLDFSEAWDEFNKIVITDGRKCNI
jgi:phosphotransferase system HPr-like phosphotransfer protein